MSISFKDMGLKAPILKAIEEMGFETPTQVQGEAIPHILNKEDHIIMSKTGSGKTAVFGLSMLNLTDPTLETPGPQGLVLTPTRELAVQVDSDLNLMAKYLDHKTTAVYGQHSMTVELQELKKGVTIVTGTPGRVYDHIQHGNLITKNIRFLVLDEADRMLDMGFFEQVIRIIKTLPRERVTLLFSATMPTEIQKICRNYMKDPVTLEIESQTKTVDSIRQSYYRVDKREKQTQLNRLLLIEQPGSCIIFCNTRLAVDHVTNFLTKKGYHAESLHGDIPQGKRTKTIEHFKKGTFKLLVATDVAARGIHVDDLSLVVNYDVPGDKDSYVHRIGRTGRAGNGGHAISLVTADDLMSLYEIEEHINAVIDEAELPTEADFEAVKETADKWILANARRTPDRTAPVVVARENAPHNHGVSRQSNPSRGPRTGEANNRGGERRPANAENKPKTGEQRTQPSDQRSRDGRNPESRENRPHSPNYRGNKPYNTSQSGRNEHKPHSTTDVPVKDKVVSTHTSIPSEKVPNIPVVTPNTINVATPEAPKKASFFKRLIGSVLGKKAE